MALSAFDPPTAFFVGASVRACIAAPPDRLWPWIGDPTRHPELAGSGEPQSIVVTSGPEIGVGTRFEAQQAIFNIIRYVARSEIVAFDPPRHFHFRVEERGDWEFTLEPRDGGTLVTHRHRFRPPTEGAMRLILPLQRVRARQNARNMVRTLENLARLAGAAPPTAVQVSYRPPTLD